MKNLLFIYSLFLVQGVMGAHYDDAKIGYKINPYTFHYEDTSLFEQHVAKEEVIKPSKKELKQFIHEYKEEIKDTLKSLKKEYSNKELKTLAKEERKTLKKKISNLRGSSEKKPMTKKAKKKMWIWIGVMILLSLLTTYLFIVLWLAFLEILLEGLIGLLFI